MKIRLFDYAADVREFDVGNIENIISINICVMSGDEVATVIYKDGKREVFDSNDKRIVDFFDGQYELYVEGVINRLYDHEFVNRTSSSEYYPE